MRIRPDHVVLAAICATCAACYSMSLLQEPTPLPPGKVRAALGVEAGSSGLVPSVGLRLGVAPRTELRAKGAPFGGEIGANVHVIDAERVDLMLMPHYFAYDVDDAFDEEPGVRLRGFGMPVVLSMPVVDEKWAQAFVGAHGRLGQWEGARWFAPGVLFGVALHGNEHFSLIPECGVQWGVVGPQRDRDTFPTDEPHFLERGSYAFSCGVGFSAGGSHEPH